MAGPSPSVPAPNRASREALLVLAFTIIGGVIRLWKPQHLGLVHFDEGIYALAGLWPFSKGGLAALDPTVIAYAPPGFPVLVGLSYLLLGISDLAAILVSVVMGTLTIPLAAWLARRTFGAGAGAAAAALVTFSGAHVAFSRMALTDVSFLFCWTLGLICAQRFLEGPGLLTGLTLGTTTGLAQLFKYNGWLIGAFVILAALLGIVTDSNERSRSRLAAVWGFGLFAALVAGVIYWPWFRFVESHGGYSRLVAHHRSYLGGPGSWLPNLDLQLQQMATLTGGLTWTTAAAFSAVAGCAIISWPLAPSDYRRWTVPLILLFLIAPWVRFSWLVPAVRFPTALILGKPRGKLLAVAWLVLVVMTPLYHPYARLWLPTQLLGCLVIAGVVHEMLVANPAFRAGGEISPYNLPRGPRLAYTALLCLGGFLALAPSLHSLRLVGPGRSPTVLAASDTLRHAVRQVSQDLPRNTSGLRLLVRPPATFYLGGKFPTKSEPNLDGLLEPGNPLLWALLDLATLQQEGDLEAAKEKLLSRWELVHEYPTQLNLPTMLDVDPGAATSGRSEAVNAPLWLLRPRTAGTPQ